MDNIKCPYCGSENMTLDARVIVTCDVWNNGEVTLKQHWKDDDDLISQVKALDKHNMRGYCQDCGYYCDAEFNEGRVSFRKMVKP